METGKLELSDLAPRIKELKARQDELNRTRVQIEADIVVQGVHEVDASTVKNYARDLHSLLEESELSEKKVFLKSFIDRITVNGNMATVNYRLPLPDKRRDELDLSVLPIDTPVGQTGLLQNQRPFLSFQ